MSLKILYFMVAALIFSRLTHQQANTSPLERCLAGGDGARVCTDCFRTGICRQDPDTLTYTIEFDGTCPIVTSGQTYCDDSLPSSFKGVCIPISGDVTNCTCTSITECIADPNNPNVVLHCESTTPVTDPECSNSIIDLPSCGCKTCSNACPLLDDPNDNCRSYFLCNGAELQQEFCSDGSCFNQESCGCEALTCSPGCPLVDDPYDDCKSYFLCNGDVLVEQQCSEFTCFDQDACRCINTTSTTTTTTTTAPSTTSPPTIPPPTTTPPTSPTTCPDACPFVDDPYDNCAKFFICNGNSLIPAECPGTLCFNSQSCQCQ